METTNPVYFNIYSYRGDKYSETYNDIVAKSNEAAIQSVQTERSNVLFALPIDKIIVTIDQSTTGFNTEHNIFEKYSNTNVLWDFGDGTKSTELSAVHWYTSPGTYRIKLYVYDADFNIYESTYNAVITVYNYIPSQLAINYDFKYGYTYGDVIDIVPTLSSVSESDEYILNYLDNRFFTFELQKFNCWQSYNVLSSIGYDIQLYAENNNAPAISNTQYYSNSFSHLSCYSAFIVNGEITNNVHFDGVGTEVYVKYDNTATSMSSIFVTCLSSDDNAVLAGTYDTKQINYVDDLPTIDGQKILIGAVFDTTGFKLQENVDSTLREQWVNHIPYTCSFVNLLSSEQGFDSSLLSGFVNINGLSGNQHNIFDFKTANTPITFTIQLTYNNQPYKIYKKLNVSSDGTILSDEVSGYIQVRSGGDILPKSEYVFTVVDNTDIYGGNVKTSITLFNTYNNVTLHVFLKCIDCDDIIHFYTNAFNVIDSNDFTKIFKVGENFDLAQTYQKIALQPILKDSTVLFRDIIGAIVGDNSDYNNLGVRIYEKIHNFVKNTQDIDTCNISYLYDTYNKYDEYITDINYDWPEELNRIINLFSIKLDKLRGNVNQFNTDFNKRGLQTTNKYGVNLGEQIDIFSPTATALTDDFIVAYEKFGEKYIKLNCNIDYEFIKPYIVFETTNNKTYIGEYKTYSFRLSGLVDVIDGEDNRNRWGWNLVLPETTDYNINDYYKFYKYIPNKTENYINNVIDWDNEYNIFGDLNNRHIFPNNIHEFSLYDWKLYKQLCILQIIYEGLNLLNNYNIAIVEQPISQIIKHDDDINIIEQPTSKLITND